MDRYQGHLPDGSGVQRHSAGGIYPFIPFGKQTEHGINWGLIMPGGRELMIGSYSSAVALAANIKAGTERGRQLRALRSLETLSGEPREEPAPEGIDWFTRRDFDCWYDRLVKQGVTTEEEIHALQRDQCSIARGIPVPAERIARYEALRAMAEDTAAA